MFVATAVFVLLMLCFVLISVVFIVLKALITGRKPAFVTTFMQFNQATRQFKRGGWNTPGQSANDNSAPTGNIIEGQSVEIRDDRTLPHDPEK